MIQSSDDPLLTRVYPGTRLVETRHGDSLARVAGRELGDPTRWPELVFINGLQAPYLTDDPAAAREGVILTGAALAVPASADFVPAGIAPEVVFGTDIRLTAGRLQVTPAGDLGTVAGADNLRQAVRHVIATPVGEARWHPRYGCGAWALIGQRATATTRLLADALARRAVSQDDRIAAVTASTTTLTGDTVRVDLTIQAIDGTEVNANVSA